MKFKKIVSAVLASVVAAGVCVANAFAVEDGKATYCFDTDAKISDFVSFGSVEQTGMKLTHNIYESVNGNGCIVVSENSGGDAEDTFGGFYVEASTLGLKNFDSCTIEMSIKLCEGADGFYDNLALFSDGMIWLSQSVPELSTDEWTTVTMQISEGAENSKAGFTIPTFKAFVGDIVYIDDFVVTDKDGKVVANMGDYEREKVSTEDAASTGQNILMTILLVLLILAIVGGIGLIVSTSIRRFS
ncbi:MAG: hypothetical protein IJZ61_07910 [Oscillospiraceae bacterium]|nr:hypothetical protein [Oscillospiraceae bacterium]